MYQTLSRGEMDRECRRMMKHFRSDDDYWGDYDNWGIIYKLIPRILFDFLITLHK